MATAHDFTWSDKELADMVNCFDSDGDKKVAIYCIFFCFCFFIGLKYCD